MKKSSEPTKPRRKPSMVGYGELIPDRKSSSGHDTWRTPDRLHSQMHFSTHCRACKPSRPTRGEGVRAWGIKTKRGRVYPDCIYRTQWEARDYLQSIHNDIKGEVVPVLLTEIKSVSAKPSEVKIAEDRLRTFDRKKALTTKQVLAWNRKRKPRRRA